MTSSRSTSESGSGLDSWDTAVAQVHWPLARILTTDDYAPALRAFGLLDPVRQKLGRGGFGRAYEVSLFGKRAVLKLTRDPMEVLASWVLRGKKTRHVVPIHAVWSLPRMQKHPHWASWWLVHRDYLNDVSDKDVDLLETLHDFWRDPGLDLSIPQPGSAGRGMREKWRLLLRSNSTCSPRETDRALMLLDEIAAGVRELGAVGIEWADILPDNLLMDSGRSLRIADVGFGHPKVEFECEPPELTVESVQAYLASGQQT